ncbi:MAG TPA: hypothetical protein VFT53_07575 [Candidatus Saccharimonadales bacterium]|nr:hypothetical protein [Candidatus Saccharimonadales bacterium]
MTTLIIGSTAAKHWIPDFRDPKDFDIFSDVEDDEIISGVGFAKYAGMRIEPFVHSSFTSWFSNRKTGWQGVFATLDELYTIKISHAYWELPNGSWTKHMDDAACFKRHGAVLLPELHDLLYKVWVEKHGAKKTNLNMDKSGFFDDAVTRVYDHDSIHASVAYGDHPLYEDVMADGQSVKTDMRKVWALPFEKQVMLFREEVYATALERIVIPREYRCSPRFAYAWALRRTITSLTKGRSALFLADNYELFRSPDMDYVKRHRDNAHKLIRLEK